MNCLHLQCIHPFHIIVVCSHFVKKKKTHLLQCGCSGMKVIQTQYIVIVLALRLCGGRDTERKAVVNEG